MVAVHAWMLVAYAIEWLQELRTSITVRKYMVNITISSFCRSYKVNYSIAS